MAANNAQIEKFFNDADVDKSGFLTVHELTEVLKKNGYKVDDKKVAEMFNAIDVEGDQKVSHDEYLQAMGLRPATDHKAAHMRRVFRSFDKSGDGKIDRAELDAVFDEMKSDLSDAEIARMHQLLDADSSGYVDYEEFVKHMFGDH